MDEGVWGIRPKNREQVCALDILLDDSVEWSRWWVRRVLERHYLRWLQVSSGRRTIGDIGECLSLAYFPLGRDIGSARNS